MKAASFSPSIQCARSMDTYVCIYIYIYVERERENKREREIIYNNTI